MIDTRFIIDDFVEMTESFETIDDDVIDWLRDNGFFVKPAAINHHGNYTGGLYEHSWNVTNILLGFDLKWERPESPYIVGMFHDVCKMDDYMDANFEKYGAVMMGTGDPISDVPNWVKNPNALKGHGDKSVMMLSTVMQLTEEEMYCIRYHMGAYRTEDWGEIDIIAKKYPNILYAHFADNLASKMEKVTDRV